MTLREAVLRVVEVIESESAPKTFLTPMMRHYLRAARRERMSCPLGRAIYAVNRRYNGDEHVEGDFGHLRACSVETARRWLLHVKNGGSVKALKYSAVEWNAHRAKLAKELRARLKKHHFFLEGE